jgi:hypothetical protein
MDTALNNLTAVIASIQSVKQADGVSPRNLIVKGIACGPKLYPRAVQLCNAKFIAQSTAGTGDVEAVVASMGLGQPILVPELAGFESDTTYFVIAEQIGGGEIGPLVYVDRESFQVTYFGGATGDSELGRLNVIEAQSRGRCAVMPGHPFLIYKCKDGA